MNREIPGINHVWDIEIIDDFLTLLATQKMGTASAKEIIRW